MLASLFIAIQAATCPIHHAVLDAAAAEVGASYVDAAQALEISSALREWGASGRYDAECGDPESFLKRLNRDLDVYDGHFHVEQAAAAAEGDDWLMQWRSGARASNAGIREVRVLEGNIGYIRLATFYSWDMVGEKLKHAWALVGDTEGLVLDLRHNGGGAADTPMHVLASLLGPEVGAVQDIVSRDNAEPEILPRSELARYTAPVVVLVDRRTASAAEYLAYSLQAQGRALVVGTRTAGVAHLFGDPVPLAAGFQILIPDARPVNRTTGGNWEQVGVTPDVPGGDDPLFLARARLAGSAGATP